MKTQLTESQIQEAITNSIIKNEIIYCVSSLVYELSQKTEGDLYDEFPDLFQGSPSFGEYTCPDCYHTWDDEPEEENCPECKAKIDSEESDQFEPTEYSEVFEHWIVSEWLANRLEEKGETIEKDFYGLTIWGRCTTGQSICLDYVIKQIWQDLQND
jgi:hypothetical protein